MENKVIAAFETAPGYISALYSTEEDGAERLQEFISASQQRGVIAKLHVFTDMEKAYQEYAQYEEQYS